MEKEVKKKFRIRLIEKDLTQKALAERLNVSEPIVSLLLSGKRRARDLQISIARIVEMDPRELWHDNPI